MNRSLVCLAAWCLLASSSVAEPLIREVSPRGATIGEATSVRIRGVELHDFVNVVIHDLPSCQAELIESTDEQVSVRLSLPNDVTPGIYQLRLMTRAGVSNPIPIGVDRLVQLEFGESFSQLPVAFTGRLTGQQILRTEFVGEAGQSIVIDCEGRRLGSNLRPLVRLISPDGKQLAASGPNLILAGDARLRCQLPVTGQYSVELHDVLYQAPPESDFRLKIGELVYADVVFPLAVSSGRSEEVELRGDDQRLRATAIAGSAANATLQFADEASVRWFTGVLPRPIVSSVGEAEVMEATTEESTELAVPAGVSGCLSEPGEADRYLVRVNGQSKLRCEVYSQRLGTALDSTLEVLDHEGKRLAYGDDQAGTRDPGVDVDLPDGMTHVRLVVSSLTQQSGAEMVYRLVVKQRPEGVCEVELPGDRLNMASGTHQVLALTLNRSGVAQRQRLQLPASLQHMAWLTAAEIFPEDEVGLLGIATATESRGLFPVRLTVRSVEGSEAAEPVRIPTVPGAEAQSHFRETLAVAVLASPDVSVAWLPQGEAYLARGVKQILPVRISGAVPGATRVRLSLLTTQKTPRKTEGNQNEVDTARALVAQTEFAVDQAEPSVNLELPVPVELPLRSWGLAIRGEWLASEGDRVLASACSHVQRRPTIEPLSLEVKLPEQLQLAPGDVSAPKLAGTLKRHADFAYDVRLFIEGLPEGYSLPPITVSQDQTEFEFPLVFADGTKPGELKDLQLVAKFADEAPERQNVRASSDRFALTVK